MLWTTENVFNITKVKTNTVWMWWLTPAVQHSGKLKQRQLWVQGQPGLCSHLLMQKSPSLPKVNLVWNGLHDTILNMSNTKMEPKNLHVGTWACEMARWVKGLPEFSLGTPYAGKRKRTLVSTCDSGQVPVSVLQVKGRESHSGTWNVFHFSTHLLPVCSEYGWITWWKGLPTYLLLYHVPLLVRGGNWKTKSLTALQIYSHWGLNWIQCKFKWNRDPTMCHG